MGTVRLYLGSTHGKPDNIHTEFTGNMCTIRMGKLREEAVRESRRAAVVYQSSVAVFAARIS
jgi:hypothetical protein